MMDEYKNIPYVKKLQERNDLAFRKKMMKVIGIVTILYLISVIPQCLAKHSSGMLEMLKICIWNIPQFLIILGIVAFILHESGKRIYRVEVEKIKEIDTIANQVIQKQGEYELSTTRFIWSEPHFFNYRALTPHEIKLTNHEQEIFLKDILQTLKEIKMQTPQLQKAHELDHILLKTTNPMVHGRFRQQLLKNRISRSDSLEKGVELADSIQRDLKEILHYYENQLKIIGSGNRGEARVEEELRIMANENCHYLSNVLIQIDEQTVETDNIVFTPNGIFFIEVKNFAEKGQYKLRITKDGQWQQVYPNGEIKLMKDVQAQNNRHIFLKEKFIRQQWKQHYAEPVPSIQYRSVIVIANDTVMIENESDIPVIRISHLYHHMNKFQDNLSQEVLERVENIIRSNQLPAHSYAVLDYSKDIKSLKTKMNLLEHFGKELLKVYLEFDAVIQKEIAIKRKKLG